MRTRRTMGPIKLTSDLDTSHIFRHRKTTSLLKKSRTIQGGSNSDSTTPSTNYLKQNPGSPPSPPSNSVAASRLPRTPLATSTSKNPQISPKTQKTPPSHISLLSKPNLPPYNPPVRNHFRPPCEGRGLYAAPEIQRPKDKKNRDHL